MRSVLGKIWRNFMIGFFFTVYMFFMANLFANVLGVTLLDLVKQLT